MRTFDKPEAEKLFQPFEDLLKDADQHYHTGLCSGYAYMELLQAVADEIETRCIDLAKRRLQDASAPVNKQHTTEEKVKELVALMEARALRTKRYERRRTRPNRP